MTKSKKNILKDNAKYFLETQDKKEKKWQKTPSREEVIDARLKIDLVKHPVVTSADGDKLVPVKQLYEKKKAEVAKDLLRDALVKK